MKQLHKKLTFLYTATTGAILAAVLIGILIFNINETRKTTLQEFQDAMFTLSSRFQYGSTVSGSFMAQMEAKNQLIIHIEENQRPFLYTGSWKSSTDRNILIERAKEAALLEDVNTAVKPVSASLIRSSTFTVSGDFSDSYYGSVLVLPTSKGFQSMTLLKYQPAISSILWKQLPLFLALFCFGIGALFTVSWFFVGKALEPVEKSQERQTRFIAAASHELRSPLAVIESSISAMIAQPKDQNLFLNNIRKECKRLASLVSDMLLLASTDAKTWSLYIEPLDMDTLLIDIYERFTPLCREKGVELELKLPEESLPRIQGDRSRLEQVLTVLVDNALFYTPSGKSITLKAYEKHHRLILEVSDEGCGIPDEIKPHIFERFYKGDSARTDKNHFGLGLSIAKELVLLHHGEIVIRDSESGGSCFMVGLPV